jgi:hypothetical protein
MAYKKNLLYQLFHKIYKDKFPLGPCITFGKVKTHYGVPNMVTSKSILRVFKCIFKHRKLDKKIIFFEMVLTFFFHVQVSSAPL